MKHAFIFNQGFGKINATAPAFVSNLYILAAEGRLLPFIEATEGDKALSKKRRLKKVKAVDVSITIPPQTTTLPKMTAVGGVVDFASVTGRTDSMSLHLLPGVSLMLDETLQRLLSK